MTEALKLAEEDGAFLRNMACGLTYNDTNAEAEAKHRLAEIGMRISTGYYTALAQQEAQAEPVDFETWWGEESNQFTGFGPTITWGTAKDFARRAWNYTRPAPVAEAKVPEGWKLVPIEPTPEMVEAACQDGHSVGGRPLWKNTLDIQARHRYAAMLAEAPQPGDGK